MSRNRGDGARIYERSPQTWLRTFDKLERELHAIAFHWTLSGTNTGPVGTGKHVRISGYELWQFDDAGLIAESQGHFDSAAYKRQIEHGVPPS